MGSVEAIFIAPVGAKPLEEVPEVRALVGKGLEGDRYFLGVGTFSHKPGFRNVTLIESEAVEALAKDYALELGYGEPRRNIVTRGVALNHLVGKEFSVGEVRMRGMKLCEPCGYLQKHLGNDQLIDGLKHRGGLRAEILKDGIIRKGDPVATF
ncbi:MAG: MOSC domain-containing protein [Actinomycetota bacterium]